MSKSMLMRTIELILRPMLKKKVGGIQKYRVKSKMP